MQSLNIKKRISLCSQTEIDEFGPEHSDKANQAQKLDLNQPHTWKIVKVKKSQEPLKRREVILQREWFEREQKVRNQLLRKESLKDEIKKNSEESDRRERMINTLLNKEQTEYPFVEIPLCVNELSLQVQVVTVMQEY